VSISPDLINEVKDIIYIENMSEIIKLWSLAPGLAWPEVTGAVIAQE